MTLDLWYEINEETVQKVWNKTLFIKDNNCSNDYDCEDDVSLNELQSLLRQK